MIGEDILNDLDSLESSGEDNNAMDEENGDPMNLP